MQHVNVNRPGRGWDAMAVVSVLYLPMAALAMGPYFLDDPTLLVSQLPEGGFRLFVEGALAGRTGPYQAHLLGMVSHTLTGAMLMGLGPYLLWSRPRRRTRSHVIAGRVYLATALASMTGAFVFLVNEPLEAAFTGPVFALGLWAMFVGTVFSALAGWVSALRHRIPAHIMWVCLNYGFLMSAPLLRTEWGLFGIVGVGDTLEEVSPQSAIHIVALTAGVGVIGGLHLADHLRPQARTLGAATATGARPAPPRWTVIASVLLGGSAFAVMAGRYLDHGRLATTHIGWYAVPVLGLVVAVVLLRRRALRRGRAALADDLLVLVCWLALSPAVAVVISAVASAWLDLEAPVADATGLTLCGGLAAFWAVQTLDGWSQLVDRRRKGTEAAPATHSRETARAS